MTTSEGRVRLLRERGDGPVEVTPVELFFDLVYVLAITQLTHHLLEHLTLRGAGETLLLLLLVWGTWTHIAWTTNYFDLGTRAARLALIGVMLASLLMSAWLPEAFGDRGLAFAVALVTILAGWSSFVRAAVGRGHHLSAVFERVLVWEAVSGVLLIVGGLAEGDARAAIWLVAVVLIYVVMWFGFPVPGRGRNLTTDYTIAGGHMAHRFLLFVILALGESILIAGANFGELPSSAATVAAFLVAFVGSVAFWWIYFDRAEEAGLRVMSAASDPGRLGVTAYTYFHIPLVAGIIVAAAGDELAIAHPSDPATVASTALILGGPALYLIGNALFKWAVWGAVPRTRLIAGGALAALVPVAVVASALALMVTATLVLVGVALWDVRTLHRRSREAGGEGGW